MCCCSRINDRPINVGWITFWPEWHFGQSDSLARVTLWPETLWPEWHFGQFFLLPLGYQRVKKKFIGGTKGKNLKKIINPFFWKVIIFLFLNFSLWSPLWIFFFILWYPKGSKKNWPKCHPGQNVTLAKVSLAKVSLWPKCH